MNDLPLITADGALEFGSPEHAAAVTEGRHPGVRDGLQWLTFTHLLPALQVYSSIFYSAAVNLIGACRTDSPELTTSINSIIAAKDSAVRAGIRNDTGRAGSVPRPQTVVNPPKLDDEPFYETTLEKIHEALTLLGLDEQARIDAINEMQNRGILFRERDTVS